MRVGVVTVFKSENCGSFLQAWALQKVLQQMGHEVYFLQYKKLFERKIDIAFQVLKCCVKGRFSTACFLMERRYLFHEAQKRLNVCLNDKEIDACIFGSDTIWNFEDSFFRDQSEFFLGTEINCPKIGYAISAGATSSDSFFSVEGIKYALTKFSSIGVRDINVKNILNLIGKNVTDVLDPTLLLSKEQYLEKNNISLPKRYVFVYYFGNMSDELYLQLCEFCKKSGLDIVHMGFPDKRFSTNITNSPDNFISCYKNADYVLTNTFHGCIFSILFNKAFATDGFNKKKIADLIYKFDLNSQCISESQTMEICFTKEIDYKSVNEKMTRYRADSFDFLSKALSEIEISEESDFS